MCPPRSASPESIALALQSIQLLVEASLGSLGSNHHVVRAVVAECNELWLGAGHLVCGLEALEVCNDGSLGFFVAEVLADLGAVVDEAERWVGCGVDVVDCWHRWHRIRLVKREVLEGDIGGASVPDDGGVISDRGELVEDLQLIATGVECGEVCGSGWDSHEDLLRLDETAAVGSLDKDLDAAVRLAHTLRFCDLGGQKQRVCSLEFCSNLLEEKAVVHHRASLELLQSC